MAFTPKLTYKGRPLVRCKNDIYYGSLSDPYVIFMQVLTSKEENGVQVADRIHVTLLSTDTTNAALAFLPSLAYSLIPFVTTCPSPEAEGTTSPPGHMQKV